MNTKLFTTSRIAGALMLVSLIILLGAAGYVAAQGRLEGMAAAFRGVGSYATRDASGLRIIARPATIYLMAQLAGFALFTRLLLKAGDQDTAIIALTLFVVWVVLGAIEFSFHASVTVWAAGQARIGTAPEFYEPLRRWLNNDLQLVNMSFLLTALLLFSGSALRARLLPSWIGWSALAWSLLSFPLYFLVFEAPLVYLATPLLLGVGLVWRG